MKLAFSTLAMGNTTLEIVALLCQRHQMAAEVRCQGQAFLYSQDIPITNIGTSICLKGYDEVSIAQSKQLLLSAKEKNIKGARVFLGNFFRRFDDQRVPLDEEGMIKSMRELSEVGVDLWIETHNEYATGKALAAFIQKVDRANVGVIWDILHPIEDGESIAETWSYLAPYVRHIHIKDACPPHDAVMHDWYYTKLGEGTMPVREIVSLVLGDGYDGYFSLEWEAAWREELRGVCDDIDQLLCDYRQWMENMV